MPVDRAKVTLEGKEHLLVRGESGEFTLQNFLRQLNIHKNALFVK